MQKARTGLDEGKIDVNESYTDATFSTWEKIFIAMIFARLPIFFLSFKYLKVTKLYIYYNLMFALIWDIGLPSTMGTARINYVQVSLLVIFILDYFHFWAPVLCMTIIHLSQIASESILYGNEITASLFIHVHGVCVIQFLHFFTVHIIITQVGMIFVDSEIVRIGNDQVLNNLKEGIIIFH